MDQTDGTDYIDQIDEIISCLCTNVPHESPQRLMESIKQIAWPDPDPSQRFHYPNISEEKGKLL